MEKEQRRRLEIISAYIGSPLTEEQMEFASDFTRDTISFSDAGTGKTHTLIAGIVMAQSYYNIDGSNINCMSFTKAAVSEIKGRYDRLCKKLTVAASAKFNTFHSLSLQIMKDAFPDLKIVERPSLQEDLEALSGYMNELGLNGNDFDYVKSVYNSINKLNSSLCFNPDNLMTKYDFQMLNISVEAFQSLRTSWFLKCLIRGYIVKGDIPLYCLYALMNKPHIIDKWKGRYGIMIVDEFQDLSLLHLHILSYIAETLIVIGDMKQQIYHFNGACQQIVDQYMLMRPNARICNLTKSFRCKQNIADFATKVVLPNDKSIKAFEGITDGGEISVMPRKELKWKDIAKSISDGVESSTMSYTKDVMFLYRNNASAIPIIEELYKLGIPFRCSKFARVMDVPIFKELCTLANVAWQPNDVKYAEAALMLFPEFRKLSYGSTLTPIVVMEKLKCSFFDTKVRYKDNSSYEIINAMLVARKKMQEGASAGVVLNNLLGVYEKYIIEKKWWKLDNPKEFYFNLVAPICNAKQYPIMYNEENDKFTINRRCIDGEVGVRCYTMHSAKGLEADIVYILDCDEGLFPNAKTLKRKVDAGCLLDAAAEVRSERNLLYVAITRAKSNVVISYSSEPAKLLVASEDSEYTEYDRIYEREMRLYDDADEFLRLFRLGKYKVR